MPPTRTTPIVGMSPLFVLFVSLVACAPAPPATVEPVPIHERTIVDLTWTLDETTIAWPTSPGFSLETQFDGVTPAGFYYLSHLFSGPEHGGTHIDAPVHFSRGRHATDQIPLLVSNWVEELR